MYRFRITITLYILGLIYHNQAKVILNVHIYNYQNDDNLKHDGSKCENFHWLGDHCDPMFKICVTNVNPCDILGKKINFWKNQKRLYSVMTQDIFLDKWPRSISVVVQVDDDDNFDHPDHIAVFTSKFRIKQLGLIYRDFMSVNPSSLNVKLQASVSLKCSTNYFGPTCDDTKEMKMCAENCVNGICTSDKTSSYVCLCNPGWTGIQCSELIATDCSKLICSHICNISNNYFECYCNFDGYYKKACQEKLVKSTTPLEVKTEKPTQIITVKLVKKTTPKKTSLKTTRSTLYHHTSTFSKLKTETTKGLEKIIPPTSLPILLSSSETTIKAKPEANVVTQMSQNQKLIHENIISVSGMNFSTILIICLLILLCISVIGLFFIIRNWNKKNKSKSIEFFKTHRPLPPVIYQRDQKSVEIQPIKSDNLTTIQRSRILNESSKIPFSYPKYDSKLELIKNLELENTDPYEEPIINNMESLTCETDVVESDDSDIYEKPINYKKENRF